MSTSSSSARLASQAVSTCRAFRKLFTSFPGMSSRSRWHAVAGVFALVLLLGAIAAPAYAQNVTLASVQTTVPASGLGLPYGVAVDGAGNVFIADRRNNRVVEVTPSGVQSTVPASGLSLPNAVAVDGAGDVFIADRGNNRVVKVTPSGGQTTVGSGLSYPLGVAVDGAGDVFIADNHNNRVVKVTPGGGQTTVGSGLSFPWGVAVDGAGDVFIADNGNDRVVEVTLGGVQTTVAIGLGYPSGVAVDGAGDVFIADSTNNRVVEVPAGGGPQFTVGSGLSNPSGVAVDGAGDVFIADSGNGRAVEVQTIAANFGSANVCPGSQTTPAPCKQTPTLNYNVTATTTFGTTTVLTQGAPNLDYKLSSGSTCTGTVTAGSPCTVNVTFAPLAPGVRLGAVQLFDNSSDLLVSTLVHAIGQGPAIAFGPGVQTTLPASVTGPTHVAVDAAGDVFIADYNNNLVVKLTPSGVQTTVPASGLNGPEGVAVDGAGDIFITNRNNNLVVEVTPGGVQTTVPASGLSLPLGVAVDGAGNVFIADKGNNRVVELTPSGVQTTVPASGLNGPKGVTVDGAGDVFIADTGNNQVVEVTPSGVQTTVPASGLNNPQGMAVDGAGDVFIVDTNNSRVVEVTPGGVQTTVPASGLNNPQGLAVDGAGDVFIADTNNHRVVEVIRSQPPSLSFASTNVGSTSSDSPQSVTIQNIGNQPLDAVTPGLVVTGPNFLQVAGTGTPEDCSSSFALTPGETCNLSLSFEPQTTGSLTSTAVFTDSALNTSPSAAQTIPLSGTGTTPGIYAPAGGSTLTSTTVTFQWGAHTGATAYWLDVGKEAGGNEYYQSGSLSPSSSSQTVNSLPSDGSTVYATWYYLLNGSWVSTGYTYTAFGVSAEKGAITSPAPSTTLTGSSVTFTWTAGSGATAYWIDAGSSAGGNQYYQSGNLGNVLTKAVSGLPTNGSTVYVTLYSLVSGQWLSNAYTYTAYNQAGSQGVITTPTPGSTLSGSSVTFGWTAGTGATAYWLDVGSTAGGSQYFQSGNMGNVLTVTVNGLPMDGSTVYATLYSLVNGQWLSNAYTYTAHNSASNKGVMQTPTPGSILSGHTVTFTWSAGSGATAYWVDMGSAPGGNNYYQSGNLGNVLTTTVHSLPANGSQIYVTLYSYVGGGWLYNSYTYTSGP